MLPYTPLHSLLFACGAPDVLVMTSANRSSEPIAYEDYEALRTPRRHRGRVSHRRAADRPPRGGFRRPRGRVRARDLAALARLRAVGRGRDTVLATDPGRGRRPEKRGHARRGWPGLCQPAHRRPRSLRRVSARSGRPSTIWCRCTESAASDAVVAHDAHPQYRSTLHALELPAAKTLRQFNTTARTSPRCSPSARPGKSTCWASASTAPATERTEPSGAASFLPEASRAVSNEWPTCVRRLCRRGCRGAISRAGRRRFSGSVGGTARPRIGQAIRLPAAL